MFTAHGPYDRPAAKASAAALWYILGNAVRYKVSIKTFENELLQLGLPKDHSSMICKIYEEFYAPISDRQLAPTAKVSQIKSFKLEMSSRPGFSNIHLVNNWEVNKGVIHEKTEHFVGISNENLGKLLNELRLARIVMEKYTPHPK